MIELIYRRSGLKLLMSCLCYILDNVGGFRRRGDLDEGHELKRVYKYRSVAGVLISGVGCFNNLEGKWAFYN